MASAPDRIMRWFDYAHLTPDKQAISKIFHDAAEALVTQVPTPSAERTVALRKLVEAKDCAVRAYIEHTEAASG